MVRDWLSDRSGKTWQWALTDSGSSHWGKNSDEENVKQSLYLRPQAKGRLLT